MNTVVWYLVFSFWSNGGVATIPQANRDACMETVKWLEATPKFGSVNATCIPGTAVPGVAR